MIIRPPPTAPGHMALPAFRSLPWPRPCWPPTRSLPEAGDTSAPTVPMTLVGGGRGMALLSQRREKRSPIRVPVVASAISPTGLPTPPLAPGCLFQPQGKALTAPRSPASLKLPFSQMLDGGAEPQSSPTSRAGVGEGEAEGLARGAGGPGQAAGRAGSVVETQRALLWGCISSSCWPSRESWGLCKWKGTQCQTLAALTPVCAVLSLFSRVRLFATPWTVVRQGYLSRDSPGKNMEWVAIPSSGGYSYPVIELQPLASPASAGGLFTTRPPAKSQTHTHLCLS